MARSETEANLSRVKVFEASARMVKAEEKLEELQGAVRRARKAFREEKKGWMRVFQAEAADYPLFDRSSEAEAETPAEAPKRRGRPRKDGAVSAAGLRLGPR